MVYNMSICMSVWNEFHLSDFIAEEESEETVHITTEILVFWTVRKRMKWFIQSGQKQLAQAETQRIGRFLTHASKNIRDWEIVSQAQDE
jgi:hypothetical protein